MEYSVTTPRQDSQQFQRPKFLLDPSGNLDPSSFPSVVAYRLTAENALHAILMRSSYEHAATQSRGVMGECEYDRMAAVFLLVMPRPHYNVGCLDARIRVLVIVLDNIPEAFDSRFPRLHEL